MKNWKVIEDKALSLILLTACLPLMLIISLLIKVTSKGPVIFRQKRQGLQNRVFIIYKFRTLHVDTTNATQQVHPNDPRVTPLGKILRKTSLDELPQFINVLKGDMSIVGPRPHIPEENQRYTAQFESYHLRHLVKPGITGWAQVNGLRGYVVTSEQIAERLKHDLHYIKNMSPALDLKILIMTIQLFLKSLKK